MPFFSHQNKIRRVNELTDEELASQYFDSNDPELAGELFKRYSHLVFGVCMKYLHDVEEAKDVVMQIFELLLTIDQEEEVRNFKGWLFTVSKNHCLMKLRHEKAGQQAREQKLQELESEIMEIPSVMHLYEAEEKESEINRLHKAIQRLGHEQRTCIELFYLEDKLYKEISEMTGFDLKAVKSHIQNGKRNLKIMLNNGRE